MRPLLLLSALLVGCAADERPMIVVTPDGTTTEVQPCATGCAAPTADELHHLSDGEIAAFLDEVDSAPIASPTLALESLLFYRADTLSYLARTGPGDLDPGKLAWLRAELERDHAEVEMRLVDASGAVRGTLNEWVPLVEKQHLRLKGTGSLGRLAINGKVKRVGVDHLWARF